MPTKTYWPSTGQLFIRQFQSPNSRKPGFQYISFSETLAPFGHIGPAYTAHAQYDSLLVKCNITTPTMMSPSAATFIIVIDSWKNHSPIIATSAVPIPDHRA